MTVRYEIVDPVQRIVVCSSEDQKEILGEWNRINKDAKAHSVLDLVEVRDGVQRSLLLKPEESEVRVAVGMAHGKVPRFFASLEEARHEDNAYVVMEGDFGGQIYLTAPVAEVRCSEEKLAILLQLLNNEAWPVNNTLGEKIGNGAKITLESHETEDGIWGGMGGGKALKSIWVHDDFRQLTWEVPIAEYLHGERDDLPAPRAAMSERDKRIVLEAYKCHDDAFRLDFDLPPLRHGTSRKRMESLSKPENSLRWSRAAIRAVPLEFGLPIPPVNWPASRATLFRHCSGPEREEFTRLWHDRFATRSNLSGASEFSKLKLQKTWHCRSCKWTGDIEDIFIDSSMPSLRPRCPKCGACGWGRLRGSKRLVRECIILEPSGGNSTGIHQTPVWKAIKTSGIEVVDEVSSFKRDHWTFQRLNDVFPDLQAVRSTAIELVTARSSSFNALIVTHKDMPPCDPYLFDDLASMMEFSFVHSLAGSVDGRCCLPWAWRQRNATYDLRRDFPSLGADGTILDPVPSLVVIPFKLSGDELVVDDAQLGLPLATDWYGNGTLSEIVDDLRSTRLRLNEIIETTTGVRLHNDPRWELAVGEELRARGRLYSPGFALAVGRVRRGDARGLDGALAFLREDPYCFRSGYMKDRLLRYLCHLNTSEDDRHKIEDQIVRWVSDGELREVTWYVNLAHRVWSEGFCRRLSAVERTSEFAYAKLVRLGVLT